MLNISLILNNANIFYCNCARFFFQIGVLKKEIKYSTLTLILMNRDSGFQYYLMIINRKLRDQTRRNETALKYCLVLRVQKSTRMV